MQKWHWAAYGVSQTVTPWGTQIWTRAGSEAATAELKILFFFFCPHFCRLVRGLWQPMVLWVGQARGARAAPGPLPPAAGPASSFIFYLLIIQEVRYMGTSRTNTFILTSARGTLWQEKPAGSCLLPQCKRHFLPPCSPFPCHVRGVAAAQALPDLTGVELRLLHHPISPSGAFQLSSQGPLISGSFWEVVQFLYFFKLLKITALLKKGKGAGAATRGQHCLRFYGRLYEILSRGLGGAGWSPRCSASTLRGDSGDISGFAHHSPSLGCSGTLGSGCGDNVTPKTHEVQEDVGFSAGHFAIWIFQGCPVRGLDFLLACPDRAPSSMIFIPPCRSCGFLSSRLHLSLDPRCTLRGGRLFSLLRICAAKTSANR